MMRILAMIFLINDSTLLKSEFHNIIYFFLWNIYFSIVE